MGPSVLIPWRGDCPYREAALSYVQGRYEAIGWQTVIADCRTEEWSKAAAIMDAAPGCGETVVIADADCWCDGVQEAARVVIAGESWAVPHTLVHRLTAPYSSQVINDGADPAGLPAAAMLERPYRGIKGGGIVAVRRDVLLQVPFDRRFVGWGKTDRAWRDAMKTLVGEPWRGGAPLWHFWHPPQPRVGRIGSSPANERLYARYREARGDRDAMRKLVDECMH